MPPVLQNTGRWVRYEPTGGLPAVCGSSFSKARSWPFGLFLYALELNVDKDGMKRIKRIFQILQEERE